MMVDFRKQSALLYQARELARKGQKEEAAKIANEVLASSPSRGIELEAKDLLKNLDKLAAEGEQMPPGRRGR
jgi:hypothetical protein